MVTIRRLTKNYGISKSSAHRILTEGPEFYVYTVTIEPKLREEPKSKQKTLVNWISNNF